MRYYYHTPHPFLSGHSSSSLSSQCLPALQISRYQKTSLAAAQLLVPGPDAGSASPELGSSFHSGSCPPRGWYRACMQCCPSTSSGLLWCVRHKTPSRVSMTSGAPERLITQVTPPAREQAAMPLLQSRTSLLLPCQHCSSARCRGTGGRKAP